MRPPPPVVETIAFVPFAWEEEPGVPKTSQDIVNGTPAAAAPSQPHPAIDVPFPLCKPPRLQAHEGIQGPLGKTPSFNSILSASPHGSKRLVRRPSLDNIICSSSKSGHVECFFSHTSIASDRSSPSLRRMEDDPFLMALEACRKDAITVSHHLDTGRSRVCEEEQACQRGGSTCRNRLLHYRDSGRIRVCDEDKANQRCTNVCRARFSHHWDSGMTRVFEDEKSGGSAACNSQDVDKGIIKHPLPTIGQLLFSQHLQQDDYMQTLIGQKKHANGFYTFLASCFRCQHLISH
ncbi:hypothetical protein L7F22_023472 [Adiantum nelumboides]|nr:hypothetical protein [Adiantum nelumboides]